MVEFSRPVLSFVVLGVSRHRDEECESESEGPGEPKTKTMEDDVMG